MRLFGRQGSVLYDFRPRFFRWPICFYILYLMMQRDPARHFWIIVLSVAELYGGCVCLLPRF